jgi:alpha-L-rhamnosidase
LRQDSRKPYTNKTTLLRISKDKNAMEILGRYTPALAGIAASGNHEMGSNSLEDLLHMGYLPFDPDQLKVAIGEIENLVVG